MARRLRLDEASDLYLDHLKVERGLSRNTIDAPKTARRLPGVLGEEAVAALIAQPPDTPRGRRDAAMIELAYGAGLRVSELVTLPMAAVNYNAAFVRVTGKGNKTRVIPLNHNALNRIERYVRETRPGWVK